MLRARKKPLKRKVACAKKTPHLRGFFRTRNFSGKNPEMLRAGKKPLKIYKFDIKWQGVETKFRLGQQFELGKRLPGSSNPSSEGFLSISFDEAHQGFPFFLKAPQPDV